jgi:hypothetical protein
MNERLLQFIWQHQYFNKQELRLSNGIPFQIIHPGFFNAHQGPDFNDARIVFEGSHWAGNIELHVKTSDWNKHEHQHDDNYKNVILHVVWMDDEAQPPNSIPVFTLDNRVPKLLLHQYESWMNNGTAHFPCHPQLGFIENNFLNNWLEQLSQQRLIKKTDEIKQLLKLNQLHWEATCWILIARNFGARVNTDLFEAVAKTIPVTLLARHKQQIHALEALLFGQAGLLSSTFQEKYPQLLQKEYQFYKKKYRLQPVHLPVYFLRMRPANFPTVRFAQLAMLAHQSSALFAFIRDCTDPQEVKKQLMVTANDYWHYHFRFDQLSDYQPKQVGAAMIDNLMMNTIVPLLYAYGTINHQHEFIQKAVEWLRETNSEKNRVISNFQSGGFSIRTAMQSQGLLELKAFYCDAKRCLDCAIGRELLKM